MLVDGPVARKPREFLAAGVRFMRRSRLVLGLAVLASALSGPAGAQEEGVLVPGEAVVTGFSGFAAAQPPAGQDPVDFVSIDLSGPSARVVDLRGLGPQGSLSEAPKPFTVTAQQVGQVFGVALDDAPAPNIYLAATSVYGLSIYVPDASGAVRRVRDGAPGAQFVPGQFGPPELGGGPGSIWRVDGTTGEVALFASLEGASQGVAALGGLAYDPGSQQLFVAERNTGLIHRFGLDGTEQGTYDHGAEGRPAGGLAPFPMPGLAPVDIGSPAFEHGEPGDVGLRAAGAPRLRPRRRMTAASTTPSPRVRRSGRSASIRTAR